MKHLVEGYANISHLVGEPLLDAKRHKLINALQPEDFVVFVGQILSGAVNQFDVGLQKRVIRMAKSERVLTYGSKPK
eukprot:scaffold7545_cov592-Pinguiococcus_pyrenoidosus.AAC.1